MACTNSRKSTKPLASDIVFTAWNEDSIISYQFVLFKDNRFSYSVSKKDSLPEKNERYHGKISETPDTVFLTYKNNLHQQGISAFLIKEASGKYLIQYFTDGRKRMFLRVKQYGHWL